MYIFRLRENCWDAATRHGQSSTFSSYHKCVTIKEYEVSKRQNLWHCAEIVLQVRTMRFGPRKIEHKYVGKLRCTNQRSMLILQSNRIAFRYIIFNWVQAYSHATRIRVDINSSSIVLYPIPAQSSTEFYDSAKPYLSSLIKSEHKISKK